MPTLVKGQVVPLHIWPGGILGIMGILYSKMVDISTLSLVSHSLHIPGKQDYELYNVI